MQMAGDQDADAAVWRARATPLKRDMEIRESFYLESCGVYVCEPEAATL